MALKVKISFNLSFLKRYTSIVIPVAIVVVALLFLGVTVLQGRSLVARMDKESLAVGKQIDQVMSKAPSARQWEEEKKYQDAHAEDAERIAQLGIHSSLRDLVSYRIFPEPKDTSRQVFANFGQALRSRIEGLLTQIRGRGAPTQQEMQSQMGLDTSLSAGGNWNRANRNDMTQAMIDTICQKRAEEIGVYATPEAFAWYDFWEGYQFPGTDKAVEHCWYSQLAYWIYDDVVQAIQALNGSSTSVINSPVKRLIAVSFQKEADFPASTGGTFYESSRIAGGRMSGEDRPMYLLQTGYPSVLGVEPWTGRVCNEENDVVHFSLGVIVAANAVGDFMKALCAEKITLFRAGFDENAPLEEGIHNSITILDSAVAPVERQDKEHELYRYGEQAVVRLTLTCEYLFNRAGYSPIMPKAIRDTLSVSSQGTGQTSPGGTSGAGTAPPASRPAPSAPTPRRSGGRSVGGDDF